MDWLPPEVRDPIEDLWYDVVGGPGIVYATEFSEVDWNRDGVFTARVVHGEPLSLGVLVLRASDGAELTESVAADAAVLEDGAWVNEIELHIPDGTWALTLLVDGRERNVWDPLRIDTTPPSVDGLEASGKATAGSYRIGADAEWDADTTVEVQDPEGVLIATSLPHTVDGLTDGVHAYRVVFRDPAGNSLARLVQVLAGEAKSLPEGQHDVGIVARYTNDAAIWDISTPSAYLSRADASAAAPDHLGPGFGITPDDPDVQEVVAEVVTDGMNSMEAALALYEWLFDELEYTDERLDENDLLEPSETFANGGGVCRDLAAAYVSLLRAADVPARLVTGYLAGTVNGFHAWVEFYAGDVNGQGAWVPVDVSPIDGSWSDHGESTMWQSFGVRLPHYLPLRALPAPAEIEGWATAISLQYEYPSGREPTFDYSEQLTVEGDVGGVLCVHTETWERMAAARADECSNRFDVYFGGDQPFILQSTQVIDYGVDVESAVQGTTFDVQLAVPFASEVAPVTVEHIWYSNHDDVSHKPIKDGKRPVTLHY